MGLPDSVVVEVAFASEPFDPAPVWTDVSAYVDLTSAVRVRRGRQSETDDVQPGTLSLTLDNSDGRFTAGNAASPYYPNVTINRRIRVRAVHSGTTHYLFDGHVDKWPVAWQNGVRSLAPITATDRTKLLARRPMRTLFEEQQLLDAPLAMYPMQSGTGTTVGEVARNGQSPARLARSKYRGGSYEWGADGPWFYDALGLNTDTTASADREGYYIDFGDEPPFVWRTASAGFTVEFWLRCSGSGTSDLPPAVDASGVGWLWSMTTSTGTEYDSGSGGFLGENFNGLATSIDTDGDLTLTLSTPVITQTVSTAGAALADAEWHHIFIAVTTAESVSVTIDGSATYFPGSLSALSTMSVASLERMWFGRSPIRGYGYPNDHSHFRGEVAGLAIYDRTLDYVFDAPAHYGWTDTFADLSSVRVSDLAEFADVPTGTIQTGKSYISRRQVTSGAGVDQALRDVSRTEDGLVFFDGQGRLTFLSRDYQVSPTPDLTVSASTDGVGENLEFELSDAHVVNDMAVDRPDSAPVRTINQASIDAYGTYAEQPQTLLHNDDEQRYYAQWHFARRAVPVIRAGQVTVDPFTNPALYATALASEIGDRLRLTDLPVSTAPSATVDVMVQSVEHAFSIDGWLTSWDTAPRPTTEYLAWDSGVWDSTLWAW